MQAEEHRDPVAELVGRNDAIFREANERILNAAVEMELDDSGLLPFLCECAAVGCTTVVRLTSAEYEAVRQDATRFINAPGHVVNGRGWARVVDEREGYTIVEKTGDAAEVAEELDPRGGVSR